MLNDFKVGQIVCLQSGGPKMTVVKLNQAKKAETTQPGSVATDESIDCWWFDAGGCLCKVTGLPPDSLYGEPVPVVKPEPPKEDVKPAEVKPA